MGEPTLKGAKKEIVNFTKWKLRMTDVVWGDVSIGNLSAENFREMLVF